MGLSSLPNAPTFGLPNMSELQILVPFDFSPVTAQAARQACVWFQHMPVSVVLFHVITGPQKPVLGQKLELFSSELSLLSGVKVMPLEKEGPLLSTLATEAASGKYAMVMIGAHGPRGVRQHLWGADILQLLRKLPLPALIVPKGARLLDRLGGIVLPLGAQEAYLGLVKQTASLAKLFDIPVYLYTLRRPAEQLSEAAIINRENARAFLESHHLSVHAVEEEPRLVSFGFARQTLDFADRVGANLIAMVPFASSDYAFMADSEKVRLTGNRLNKIILSGGMVGESGKILALPNLQSL